MIIINHKYKKSFHLPRVKLLGENCVGKNRREYFYRINDKQIICRQDYTKRFGGKICN